MNEGRGSSRGAEMSTAGGRAAFEGEMVWSIIKAGLWIAIGIWLGNHA